MEKAKGQNNFTYKGSIRDSVEESIYSCESLEKVLKGIPDIIGVYNTDHTIMFFNQAGYDFYKTTADEVKGRKCYEMLFRKQQCPDCPVDKAISIKQIVRKERYIPKIGKYVEYYCNPVLDESGEVLFAVEQIRDISDRKHLEAVLKESADNYQNIVNLFPHPITITTLDGIVVLANEQLEQLFPKPIIGEKIEKYAPPDFSKTMKKRIEHMLEKKIVKHVFDSKIIHDDHRVTDLEITISFLNYNRKPAILSLYRDVSERKRELNTAANFQKQALKKAFPIADKVIMETLYVPAKTVSGDFYFFHKVNDHLVVGILGDVSGKGITAALSISAFNVLFKEEVLLSHNPSEILHILNKKVSEYLGEKYIAACCFSFDFMKNEAKVVGAGISRFIFQSCIGSYVKREVKGPFLGMFDNSVFDEQLVQFQPGDKFYFFTDGLDFVFEAGGIDEAMMSKNTTAEFIKYLSTTLEDILTDAEEIKDDCTLLALEIRG